MPNHEQWYFYTLLIAMGLYWEFHGQKEHPLQNISNNHLSGLMSKEAWVDISVSFPGFLKGIYYYVNKPWSINIPSYFLLYILFLSISINLMFFCFFLFIPFPLLLTPFLSLSLPSSLSLSLSMPLPLIIFIFLPLYLSFHSLLQSFKFIRI